MYVRSVQPADIQASDLSPRLLPSVCFFKHAQVNKHNCSSLCTLSVLSGVALCRVLDSVASSSEALQELQPRFEAINKVGDVPAFYFVGARIREIMCK